MIRRVLLVLVPVVFVSTLSYADETGFAFEEGQKVGMEFVGPNDEAPVKEVDGWPTTDDIAKLQEGAYSALRAFIESWHDASWQVTVAAIGQIGTCEADPCSNLDAACEVIYQRNGGYGPSGCQPGTVTLRQETGYLVSCSCSCYSDTNVGQIGAKIVCFGNIQVRLYRLADDYCG